MKHSISLLIFGLILCSCAERQAVDVSPAIERVQAGQDSAWNHGAYILHVTKRDGNSLEGIRIVTKRADGQKDVITADSGTVSSGSAYDAGDKHCVKIMLHDALIQQPKTQATAKELVVVLVQ